MDVQARDRLTGAVILVVLLVLLVPELLSGPERRVALVASGVSEAPPLRSYTVELGDETHTRHAASPDPATAVAAPATAAPPPASAAAPPTLAPAVAALAPPPPGPAAKATAPATSSARPASAPQPPAAAGWTVQLGSFASRSNAERLVRELKAKGYAASVTESGSGGRKLYRVRVGPAGDRPAAAALAARLRSAGHPGSLSQHP